MTDEYTLSGAQQFRACLLLNCTVDGAAVVKGLLCNDAECRGLIVDGAVECDRCDTEGARD